MRVHSLKSVVYFLSFYLLFTISNAQEKVYKINTIAFYNLENLFDTIDDPNTYDHQNPIGGMSEGEAARVYPLKIKNMAKVIADIGTDKSGYPPAVLGVCEIENYQVLEDLVNNPRLSVYNYGIIHYNSPDRRSIDVALLYRKDVFRPLYSNPKEVEIYDYDERTKRSYTRDVLYVKGLLDGEEIHFLINHWPSRGGGEKKSSPRRVQAAKVGKGIIDSIQRKEPEAKIMLMGDLNDGVYNESVKEVFKTKRYRSELKRPTDIWNPFEDIFYEGIGTIAWRDSWDLFDQIIMTKPLTKENDFSSYRFYKAGVFNPPYLRNPRGRWKGYPFRSFANEAWTGGYSDHFPVYIYLIKELK